MLLPLLLLSRHASDPRSRACVRCAAGDSRPISDVVGGLHGGKYVFSGNYAGDAFAAALAESTALESEMDVNEPWPRWATALKRSPEFVDVERGPDGKWNMLIKNVYRSWEKFYASIYSPEGEALTDTFKIEPCFGHLAPRGGANNVCNPAKPYQDFVHVSVSAEAWGEAAARGSTARAVVAFLLVRTEEEQWVFRLM